MYDPIQIDNVEEIDLDSFDNIYQRFQNDHASISFIRN